MLFEDLCEVTVVGEAYILSDLRERQIRFLQKTLKKGSASSSVQDELIENLPSFGVRLQSGSRFVRILLMSFLLGR